jgi:hypothetical protein
MKEYDNLLIISKGFVDKNIHKKLHHLKDKEEKINLLKYLIISKVKLMYMELEMFLKNSKQVKEYELLLLKASNIPHKIKLLEHNLNQKDFKKIILLIEEIKMRSLHV